MIFDSTSDPAPVPMSAALWLAVQKRPSRVRESDHEVGFFDSFDENCPFICYLKVEMDDFNEILQYFIASTSSFFEISFKIELERQRSFCQFSRPLIGSLPELSERTQNETLSNNLNIQRFSKQILWKKFKINSWLFLFHRINQSF